MPRRSPRLAPAPFAIRGTIAKDDSRFVTAGRRSGGIARGSAAPPAILPRHAQVARSLAKNNPKARETATAIDSYTCRLLELLTRPTRGPWAPDPRNERVYARERAEFCCALLAWSITVRPGAANGRK